MSAVTIDQLVFKGTHNSYSCRDEGGQNDPPLMNHPPNVQIDDFAVWVLELDFGVLLSDKGEPRAVVGHDGPGKATCWGLPLTDFLNIIHSAQSLRYRPVFIDFDIKEWSAYKDPESSFQVGKREAEGVFGANNVIVMDTNYIQTYGYPTVPNLAGKVVLLRTLQQTYNDQATSIEAVNRSIDSGYRVFRLDQYQANWTFEYGVPPNPIVVNGFAHPPTKVTDAQGDAWESDNGDVSHGEIVAEQGSYRFPFKTVGRALARAEGTTPSGFRSPLRTGFGWTVMIRPGSYAESLLLRTPLTLMKDDRYDGSVVIAGQPRHMIGSLWISFHTRDDNKDRDTGLLVQITSNSGKVLARFQQERAKKYKDGFMHTEQLQLFGPILDTDLTGAILAIDISPNGNDTWKFDWTVGGTWSDGAVLAYSGAPVDLDENKRHFETVLGA